LLLLGLLATALTTIGSPRTVIANMETQSVASTKEGKQAAQRRKVACKTQENAATCYWTHGRLAVYNGGVPNVRLWKIGTKRILGILSGPGYKLADEEKTGPELPRNVERAFKSIDARIFGDFEVCPLEPERPGVMQSACIESARNLVVVDH
jgi:hypothetical protein